MIPTSDRFNEALKFDHTEIFRADLWAFGEKQRELEVIGGSLTVDGTADHLRRTDLTLTGAEILNIPGYGHDDGDYLWPTGSEIYLYAGLEFTDGIQELLSQGVFRVSKPKVSESNDGDLITTCEGYDLSAQISRNRWIAPEVIPNNTNLGTAIMNIIINRLPGRTLNFNKFEATSFQVPAVVLVHGGESDPWKDCTDLATSGGMEVYFDVFGDPVLRHIVENDLEPDAIYDEGDDCTLLEIERDLDEERGYSGVVVSGSHPDNHPVLAQAWDIDPTSSTFVDSFGYVPYFINTQFIKDFSSAPGSGQAQKIADSMLLQVKGIIEQVNFKSIANFAHEQGDMLKITRTTVNVDSTFVLDSFTRNLEEGSEMSAVTRKKRAL